METKRNYNLGKSLRPIPFSGREQDWKDWRFRFYNQTNADGLTAMLRDPKYVEPSFALVRLFNVLIESLPAEWRTKLSLLKRITPSSVEQKDAGPVEFGSTPHPADCWARLIAHYERQDPVTTTATWRQLDNLQMGNRRFEDFVHAADLLIARLEAAGESVPNGKMLRVLFAGVSDAADPIVAQLEDVQDLTYDKAVQRLTTFYLRQEAKSKYSNAVHSRSSQAFPAVSHRSQRDPCPECGKTGHTSDKCWAIHPSLRPEKFMSVQAKLQPSPASEGQLKCRYCRQLGHTKDNCPKKSRKAPSSTPKSKAAPAPKDPRAHAASTRSTAPNPHHENEWPSDLFMLELDAFIAPKQRFQKPDDSLEFILDNGASAHCCNKRSLFYHIEELATPVRVSGVGSEMIRMAGNIIVPLSLDDHVVYRRFENVLFAPFLRYTLLSMGAMMKRGVSFSMDSAGLRGVKSGQTVITAHSRNNLSFVDTVCDSSFDAHSLFESSVVSHCKPVISAFNSVNPTVSGSSRSTWLDKIDSVDSSSFPNFGAFHEYLSTFPQDSSAFALTRPEPPKSLDERVLPAVSPEVNSAPTLARSERVTSDGPDDHGNPEESVEPSPVAIQHIKAATPDVWHRRLGHCSLSVIRKLASAGLPVDRTCPWALSHCDACQFGKQHRSPFNGFSVQATRKLERVSVDIWGPSRYPSVVGGFRYFLCFVDDYTDFKEVVFMHSRDEATPIIIAFHKFWSVRFALPLLFLRSDGEFVSSALISYCRQNGIRRELTTPRTPQHNAKAERANRSLLERTRCFLFQSGLPGGYFPEVIKHACFVGNLVPRSNGVTPVLRWESPMKHHIGTFPAFGCEVFGMTNVFESKLGPRSIRSVFLGVDPERRAFKLLSVDTRKNFVSRDVQINESCFPFRKEASSVPRDLQESIDDLKWDPSSSPPPDPHSESGGEHFSDPPDADVVSPHLAPSSSPPPPPDLSPVGFEPSTDLPAPSTPSKVDSPSDSPVVDDVPPSPPPAPSAVSPVPLRRSTRVSHAPDRGPMVSFEAMANFLMEGEKETERYTSFLDCYFAPLISSSDTLPKEPSSIFEARKSAESESWNKAAALELRSLEERGTWELVPPPPGRTITDNTWVFKRKLGPSGEVLRYKARLCARGFSQVKGVDFDSTFSPVAAYRSLRLLFALSAQFGLELHQLDVVAAFLNGKIDHDIFMKQPVGFSDGTSRVCHLKKAIYGLKQSSRLWNTDLHSTLLELGFMRCRADACLYQLKKGSSVAFLLVYVDDIVVATNDPALYSSVLKGLRAEYDLTEQPDVSWVLGWHISHSTTGIFVCQSSFTLSLLRRYGMNQANSLSTPGVPSLSDADSRETREVVAFTPTKFREAVGSLLFLTNCTRPDIAFAVGMVCRAMADPQLEDWRRVKRIFRYLAGSSSLGLHFKHSSLVASGKPILFGFSDSDWAGDKEGRRSTSGWICYVAGCPVSWASRKQTVVALSTMEAEYIALASVAREMISLRSLLRELGLPIENAKVLVDNSPAVFLAENPTTTPKSKHIDIRFHFLRDLISKQLLSLQWIPSKEQVADIFTKYLARELFERCCVRMVSKQRVVE